MYNIATSAPKSRVPPLHREALQVVKRRMEDIDSQLMADTNEAKQVPAGQYISGELGEMDRKISKATTIH